MSSSVESSLISKLQSSDFTGIHSLVSDYLHPLISLLNKTNSIDQTLIRSLAKRFLSFLNSALSILPKRLPELSKLLNEAVLVELFQVYAICLDCLDAVSSQLASKPYQVEYQRLRLIHCLESCARFRDAESEALRVLEKLRSTHFAKKSVRKGKGKVVSVEDGDCGGNDNDLFTLVAEIVVCLVRCAAMGTAKEDQHFRNVLDLVEESRPWFRPWFRGLDGNTYEKLHRVLVIQLGKCALNFLGTPFLDKDLVITFCCTTLTEYVKSPIKDQVYKIAHRICSSLFVPQENKSLYIMDILDCVARECKVEQGNTGTEFVELIYYCVYKFKTANANFCSTFAEYLNNIAVRFKQVMMPINLILRLYAAGLLLVSCNLRSRAGDLAYSGSAKFECLLGTLIGNEKIILGSPALLGPLHVCSKSNCMSSSVKNERFAGQACTHSDSDCEVSLTYTPFYLEALKFLCQPLAKSVNSERQQLVTEEDDGSTLTMLSTVQDAFHILCHLILSSQSLVSEKNGDGFDEKSGTVLNVAIAAFTLSIKVNLKLQESTQVIKQIIASKWIKTEGIKYICAALYNIAVVLYRNKQAKEASKVLNLCCKASWICVKCHCGNFSEVALKEIVREVYTRSALLLVILDDFNSLKVRKNMIKMLKNWSTANDLFERLPAPIPVVKQWVKVMHLDSM
ncbi:hypothetical protein RIF29_41698 [Crotalaria pallida]|uniref:Uncharacterized protein n=1 Tax=Crotalaria pallida TaxID=3830 RepID=A0AAN9HVK8_CROPI